MIYVKSVFGGFAALLLSYAIFVVWGFTKLAAKPGTVGFTTRYIFSPRMLFVEILIFMSGFLIVWAFTRPK